jgi:hypothetical protein
VEKKTRVGSPGRLNLDSSSLAVQEKIVEIVVSDPGHSLTPGTPLKLSLKLRSKFANRLRDPHTGSSGTNPTVQRFDRPMYYDL